MKTDQFAILTPNIEGNNGLREPQQLAYAALESHDFESTDGREVGIVLPVGCGKSGLLAIAPFALKAKRTLLIAPNLNIAQQLFNDLTPTSPSYFYAKRGVLDDSAYPESAEIRGNSSNISDLDDADIVVTNIHQLQRADNKWLATMGDDYFDLIMFDEAHHNVADSWDILRAKFPNARIVNVSATPSRADGRLMEGQIIFAYPISEAVKNGYVKRITGHRLNPRTLRYVRRVDEGEIEVGLEEVRRLGETDASFRRSIVSSEETLSTIVDASIHKLRERRTVTGDTKLKIIASALNMHHCKQIVAAYAARGMKADFVHSNQTSHANEKVHQRLENHDLDVIVQVRKLGEGFDHPYLSVAAVFSIFSNLSPFMQFVGRVMRVIPDSDPHGELNEGIVVFHVGGNITNVWNDFRDFADADAEFIMNLIDEDDVQPIVPTETDGTSSPANRDPIPVVTEQVDVSLEDIDLIGANPAVEAALQVLRENGLDTPEKISELVRLKPTKQAQRKAKRKLLDETVKTKAGWLLSSHSENNVGRNLDKSKRLENFPYVKSLVDREIKSLVGPDVDRHDYSADQLDDALNALDGFVTKVEKSLYGEAS